MSAAEIDKAQHFGRYQNQEDVSLAQRNARLDWKNKLDQKLYHKSLDLPIDPDVEDPLNVDNTKTTTVSGLDWKHLAVIAATGLGAMGLYRIGTSPAPVQLPPAPPAIVAPLNPAGQGSYKTEIEIRDATTHKPIKVDWIEDK